MSICINITEISADYHEGTILLLVVWTNNGGLTMRKRTGKDWIPLWIDKWIFGSTRIELEPAERSVFLDFLALAGKDDGWIRANSELAYSLPQLAGFLNIKIELLQATIEKCLKTNKIQETKQGIYRIVSWDDYRLSSKQQHRYCPKGTYSPPKGTYSPLKGTALMIQKMIHIQKKEKEKEKEKSKAAVAKATAFFTFVKNYFIEKFKEKYNGEEPALNLGIDEKTVNKTKGLFKNDSWKNLIDWFLTSEKADKCGCTLAICFSSHTINTWKSIKANLPKKYTKCEKCDGRGLITNPEKKVFEEMPCPACDGKGLFVVKQ